ncbi:hypothetical protein F5X71_36040 [Nocardia brasiliensis]|uniref:Uncharacterized protein n=1 Tax=Nocardia brasiliensis TaxID=37326 RepID=A0A6G9Y1C1_NOCBR|nr:hypothetical protein [Nocardia brasiliensis]QIS07009.1 hypothetical protein F5X71_36040 [Nocardia brasiliensis]
MTDSEVAEHLGGSLSGIRRRATLLLLDAYGETVALATPPLMNLVSTSALLPTAAQGFELGEARHQLTEVRWSHPRSNTRK